MNNQIMRSKSFGIAADKDTGKTYILFEGDVEGKKQKEYIVEVPPEALKMIAIEIIKFGTEYQSKYKKDIGFGDGGVDND